jgi:hypothetical protein
VSPAERHAFILGLQAARRIAGYEASEWRRLECEREASGAEWVVDHINERIAREKRKVARGR